jgi:branched-chain amino acid transport system permease protein
MDLHILALQAFVGIVVGGIYVLVASGLSLIFGVLQVTNFAHGAFYMLGAYGGIFILGLTGNFWLALVAAPVMVGVLGLVVESGLIRPLYRRALDASLMVTYALGLIIIEVVKLVWGKAPQPFPIPALLAGSMNLGFAFFPRYRLFVVLCTSVVMALLWWVLARTTLGLTIRAASQDQIMTQALGIDISRVLAAAFALGVALAALGGILSAPIRGVFPFMGLDILIVSFVVVVVGGMGSVVGVTLSGLLIGVVTSLTALFVPVLSQAVMFVVMIGVLLVRPQGLVASE